MCVMKPLLWISCVLLGGCITLDTHREEFTFIAYNLESSTTTDASRYTHTERVSPPMAVPPKVIVKTVPVPQVTPVPAGRPSSKGELQGLHCTPYLLPAPKMEPVQPNFADPALQGEQLDTVLGNYVKELRLHITGERNKIEATYKAWLKDCYD